MIRTALESDAAAMVVIYNHYILNSPATFEELELTAQDMCVRIRAVADAALGSLPEQIEQYPGSYAATSPRRGETCGAN